MLHQGLFHSGRDMRQNDFFHMLRELIIPGNDLLREFLLQFYSQAIVRCDMSNQASRTTSLPVTETITKYEALFAARTGLTIMLPCLALLDDSAKTPASFTVSPDNPCDIIIDAGGKKGLLKGLKKEHLEASVSRGFIMFYETKNDEVVRCTSCGYRKS